MQLLADTSILFLCIGWNKLVPQYKLKLHCGFIQTILSAKLECLISITNLDLHKLLHLKSLFKAPLTDAYHLISEATSCCLLTVSKY